MTSSRRKDCSTMAEPTTDKVRLYYEQTLSRTIELDVPREIWEALRGRIDANDMTRYNAAVNTVVEAAYAIQHQFPIEFVRADCTWDALDGEDPELFDIG